MYWIRALITVATFLVSSELTEVFAHKTVVADSTTHVPLPGASIYDCHGNAIGVSDDRGRLPNISSRSFPISLHYIGFDYKTVTSEDLDTVFLQENVSDLPEVVVESRRHRFLHILAYVREYSTMTTYTDTVFLFREKMVDYMLPPDRKSADKGWSNPRILTSKSYYSFKNSNGLDSVSDSSNHHFSWSDWVGMPEATYLPEKLKGMKISADTLRGKYSPTEIWVKNNDKVTVDIDLLADTVSRRWAPYFSGFFRRDIEFERFRLRFNYENVDDDTISPADITGYSFDIESEGRGHEMFRFNGRDESLYVSTNAEVYILDREYITAKEAKTWRKCRFDLEEIGIYEPMEAPDLSPDVLALVKRVNDIDRDKIRMDLDPDYKMVSRHFGRNNYRIGHRALALLKQLSGITLIKTRRNLNRGWKEFRKDRMKKNRNTGNPSEID